MKPPRDHRRIRELVELALANALDEASATELATRLQSDPDARQYYYFLLDVDSAMRGWARQTGGASGPVAAEPVPVARPYRWRAIGVAAALVLAVTAALLWRARDDGDEPTGPSRAVPAAPSLATLIEAIDCDWQSPPVATGQRIGRDELVLKSGVADVRLDNGVTLAARGPCALRLVSEGVARLREGRVTVEAPADAPFALETTTTRTTVDRRAAFGVALTASGETEVHVFDGSVLCAMPGGGEPERIRVDQARRFGPRGAMARRGIPLRRRPFERFRWRGPMRSLPTAPLPDDVILREGFAYSQLEFFRRNGRRGGWRSPPRSRPWIEPSPRDPAFGALDTRKARLRLRRGARVLRLLGDRIELADDPLYVSLVVTRRHDAAEDGAFTLSLRSRFSPRFSAPMLAIRVATDGRPEIRTPDDQARGARALDLDEPYLLVAKCDRLADRLTVELVVVPEAIGDVVEPEEWTIRAAANDLALGIVAVAMETERAGDYSVDDLRIGRTWASVTRFE